jgi:hypothetical protein
LLIGVLPIGEGAQHAKRMSCTLRCMDITSMHVLAVRRIGQITDPRIRKPKDSCAGNVEAV